MPSASTVIRKNKSYPKPNGPECEWYLGANSQYSKGERIPYNINGYSGHVVVGARNRTPKEVMQLFQSCASRTSIPDLDKTDPSKGGFPRKEEAFFQGQRTVIEHKDWDVEVISESKV